MKNRIDMPENRGFAGRRLNLAGFDVWQGFLEEAAQVALVEDLRAILRIAPLSQYITPQGKAMSVRMTAAGAFGWISDAQGYRYAPRHPSGVAWPPIPASVLAIWRAVSGVEPDPECCLINFYDAEARMGLHTDDTEGDFRWPVVSVSLGDDGLFRVGGLERSAPTQSLWLTSGDVVVMGGAVRLAYHGVDRIRFGSSSLLAKGGRINLTLRVVRQGDPAQGARLQQPR